MATKVMPDPSRLIPISRATFASSSRLTLNLRPTVIPFYQNNSIRDQSTYSVSSPNRSSSTRFPQQIGSLHPRSKPIPSVYIARRNATASSYPPQSTSADAPIPSKPSISVKAPSLDAIKEEGYLDEDVQLLPPEEAYLNITHDAVQQLVAITSREPPQVLSEGKLALRVGVESGGCHGYQYTMALTEERGVDDYVLQPEGLNCIPVVIDLVSFGLLKGATLHFATELIGSSFRLQDNPQAKQGGACGCGVSWEAK
ncbi:hypothetical protein I316_03404 [Kwoniella heveanensis BCC8398]|uniref:FeS cluster biogenesis domain-containing protein n=1 Tax=Kwoniella heveanensis BCC8398 TaxID=1296120 RepID=A0A1B9GV09_9TREE|nr:hypothetical protein I316_03404 [Kwoniella heveanensis BCC8398]